MENGFGENHFIEHPV